MPSQLPLFNVARWTSSRIWDHTGEIPDEEPSVLERFERDPHPVSSDVESQFLVVGQRAVVVGVHFGGYWTHGSYA